MPCFGPLEVTILVHPLEVRRVLGQWPKRMRAERRWLSPPKAAKLVDNPQAPPDPSRFRGRKGAE
jgi:hypothetical protein